MQLLYVWIEDYKNIKEQGFSFSSEFLFNYDKDKRVLTIEDNPNYIEGFFGDGISNVTAIVGKNGSGKSSLLEALTYFMELGISQDWIFIFSIHDENYIYVSENIPVIDRILTVKPFKSPKKYKIADRTEELPEDRACIFLSNALDIGDKGSFYQYRTHARPKLCDISLSTLLNIYSQDSFRNNVVIDVMNKFNKEELIRQIEFMAYKSKHQLFIGDSLFGFTPESICISIHNHYYNQDELLVLLSQINNSETFDNKLSELKNLIFNHFGIYLQLTEGILNDSFDDSIFFIINNIARYLKHCLDDIGIYNHTKTIYRFSFYAFISFLLQKLYDNDTFLWATENEETKNENDFQKRILTNLSNLNNIGKEIERTNLQNFIQNLDKWIPEKGINGFFNQFNLSLADSKAVDFLKAYFDSLTESSKSYLSVKWGKWHEERILSSGESVLVSLFSRFFYSENDLLQIKDLKGMILILIDEGDLYLHPQWQKRFLAIFLTFIKHIYQDKGNVQIILTSHSPFILSDLPKENVIFLDKYKEGDKEVIGGNQSVGNCKVVYKQEQTFGQNIHTLLADGFFLEDGLMGDFAKGKIDKVIHWLRDENRDETLKASYKKIIDLVGEPVLRRKLLEMYDMAIGEDAEIHRLEEEIKERNKRIEEIKKGKEAKNDTN